MAKVIYFEVPYIEKVRKYDVDTDGLRNLLRQHKTMTTRQIADAISVPLTNASHWFRTDRYFSVPEPEIWFDLKRLLGIKTNQFDESIMTFEDKLCSYDSANRVYLVSGIAPTILSSSSEITVIGLEIYEQD